MSSDYPGHSMLPGNEPEIEPVSPNQPADSLPRWRHILFGPDGLRAGWSLLAWALLFALLATALLLPAQHFLRPPAGVKGGPLPPLAALLGEGLSCMAVLGATWIMAKREGRPFTSYGLGGPSRLRHIVLGAFWGTLLLSGLVAILWSGGWLIYDGRLLQTGGSIAGYGLIWAVSFLCVGVFEESVLRGFPLLTLARGMGFWWSALLVSFVFGFAHKSNPGESPVGLFSAGLIGMVFCLSLWRSGSLWWAIGFHAAWDWAQSFVFGVADSGALVDGRLFSFHPTGNLLMSGGATGPEGSLLIIGVIGLATLVVLLTLKPRPDTASE